MATELKIKSRDNLDRTSINELKLISKNQYREILAKQLPAECFKLDTKHVFHYLGSMSVYLLGICAILYLQNFPLKLFISICMGISLASLTFFLHDLFHGSIVKSKPISYLLGLSIGLFNLFAPLFWQRVHNLHHARTGNVDDPDRSYVLAESPKSLVEKIAYKTRMSEEAYHPMISLLLISTGFFWYFFSTMFFGLIGKKISIKEDMKYQRVQELFKNGNGKFVVLFELIIIFAFQAFLFLKIANGNFLTYSLISILPVAIAHAIAMSYIHTNHFLSPLTGDIDDPLVNSLSLKNSPIVDKIFSNFSHHVEHHLFPAMSSSQYPKVRKLLLELYPERFKLIPMIDAIKMLFNTPRIYGDFTHLITSDGSKKVKCLLPNI